VSRQTNDDFAGASGVVQLLIIRRKESLAMF